MRLGSRSSGMCWLWVRVSHLDWYFSCKGIVATCLTEHHAMKTYWRWRYSSTHSWPLSLRNRKVLILSTETRHCCNSICKVIRETFLWTFPSHCNLPRCLFKHHAFLISALDLRVAQPSSCRGRLTSGERAPGAHWIGGWVDARAGLDMMVKRRILSPCRDPNSWSSSP